MDHYAAALEQRAPSGQPGVVVGAVLVVIDLRAAGIVPDPDAEAVRAAAAIHLAGAQSPPSAAPGSPIPSAILEQEAHTLGLRERTLPLSPIGSPQHLQI